MPVKSTYRAAAERTVDRCRELALCTEVPGETTRLFLTPSMHAVHTKGRAWMEAAGMDVRLDSAGNLRGLFPATDLTAAKLLIASHLDTVPNAGAFDGPLGVLLGIAMVEELGEPLPFPIEVIGFSEEEGIRFAKPFLGSLALTDQLEEPALGRKDAQGTSIAEAIDAFGLDHRNLGDAALSEKEAFAYLEFHIEQGPVLASRNQPIGVVSAIAGQTRLSLTFRGEANHAGTTPMSLRRDALAAAAEWMVAVEQYAITHTGLVATIGRIEARPGVTNIIPGEASVSLDVRHPEDPQRIEAVAHLLSLAEEICQRRRLLLHIQPLSEQASVSMDGALVESLCTAANAAGYDAPVMTSGAGHDAMIVAAKVPAVMLFLRSPNGISHSPEETVLVEDVEAALATGMQFLKLLCENRRAREGDA